VFEWVRQNGCPAVLDSSSDFGEEAESVEVEDKGKEATY